MIELLKPIFKGPLAPYREGLICSPTQPRGTVRLDAILAQAATMTPAANLTADIGMDRTYLLQQRVWPQGRRNPLYGRQHTALRKRSDGQHTALRKCSDGQQTPILLHRQCCLQYLLPGEDYCGACPLSPRFRLAEPEYCPPD